MSTKIRRQPDQLIDLKFQNSPLVNLALIDILEMQAKFEAGLELEEDVIFPWMPLKVEAVVNNRKQWFDCACQISIRDNETFLGLENRFQGMNSERFFKLLDVNNKSFKEKILSRFMMICLGIKDEKMVRESWGFD